MSFTVLGETTFRHKAHLYVLECKCGYHFGLDVSYLEQVGAIVHTCPSCGTTYRVTGEHNEANTEEM